MDNNTQKTDEEKAIRIKFKLKRPNVLIILIAIALVLNLINLYWTANLAKKFTSLIAEVTAKPNERLTGTLKETQPQQEKQQSPRVEVSIDDDPVKGFENAPVTVVEFSCFECPFCARFFEETFPLIEENYIKTGKVKWVFRDFPLPFHSNAKKAHEAAECAKEQGKFWEYHSKLFANQRVLDVNSLKQYAKDLGLNAVQFNDCLDSGRMASEVQKDSADGSEYGVSGTPTFFINGIKLVGAQPYQAFEKNIEQELK